MTRIMVFAAFLALRGVAPALGLLLALVLPVAPATAKDSGFTHGLLWRIEAAGVAPSYLFGTMHSADPEIAAPPAALKRVLESTGSVTIEVALDAAVNQAMAIATQLPEGQTLGEIAGPERMRRILETGAVYGLPDEVLQRFQPWALQLLFSLPLSELRHQAEGGESIDLALATRARARGIPVYGLETVDEQVTALSDGPVADQLVLLDAAIALNPQAESAMVELKGLYLAGDLAGMNAMVAASTGGAPRDLVDAYNDRLVRQRNLRMADRMAERLQEGNALIAVGALHLYGEDGVPGLLAKRGYRVTRVE